MFLREVPMAGVGERTRSNFMTRKAQVGQRPDRRPGPLSGVQGQARYISATGYALQGTVRPQGELTMRAAGPGQSQPIVITLSGTIDRAGIHARQISNSCNLT